MIFDSYAQLCRTGILAMRDGSRGVLDRLFVCRDQGCLIVSVRSVPCGTHGFQGHMDLIERLTFMAGRAQLHGAVLSHARQSCLHVEKLVCALQWVSPGETLFTNVHHLCHINVCAPTDIGTDTCSGTSVGAKTSSSQLEQTP